MSQAVTCQKGQGNIMLQKHICKRDILLSLLSVALLVIMCPEIIDASATALYFTTDENNNEGVYKIILSNPSTPKLLKKTPSVGEMPSYWNGWVSWSYPFTATAPKGQIWSVSDTATPVTEILWAGEDVEGTAVWNDKLYWGATGDTGSSCADDGDYVWVGDLVIKDGVADIGSDFAHELVRTRGSDPQYFRVYDHYMYFCERETVWRYDLNKGKSCKASNAENFDTIVTTSSDNDAWLGGIDIYADVLYYTVGVNTGVTSKFRDGVYKANLDGSNPVFLFAIGSGNSPRDVAVTHDSVYAASSGGIDVYKLSSGTNGKSTRVMSSIKNIRGICTNEPRKSGGGGPTNPNGVDPSTTIAIIASVLAVSGLASVSVLVIRKKKVWIWRKGKNDTQFTELLVEGVLVDEDEEGGQGEGVDYLDMDN